MSRLTTFLSAVSITAFSVIAGCSSGEDSTQATSTKPEIAVRQTTDDSKQHKESTTAEPAADVVQLGSPDLTAGIPGDGPLSVEQIRTWLADEGNHVLLTVMLPRGLEIGKKAITGLEENPMTRAKIELGRQLYFDRRLSADHSVSCADCHHPDDAYGRHTQFGVGIGGQTGNRNSPVAYNRILSGPQFWDGRAASLEEQAVGPIANPIEMGNTHEAAVETIQGIEGYRLQFERIFGGPVTIENIGKAIATFERALVTGPSVFDFYDPLRTFEKMLKEQGFDPNTLKEEEPELAEQYEQRQKDAAEHPMSESAKRGLDIFFSDKGRCSLCHVGANLADEQYHNLGVGMDKEKPDLGRYAVTNQEKDKGAFKTPTIRNVVDSAPYMHDGSLKTLEEVVEWYNKGGHPNPHLSEKVKKLNLTDKDKADLIAFMEATTGTLPPVETGRLPK